MSWFNIRQYCLWWPIQEMSGTVNSQKIPHTLPSQASYGVSIRHVTLVAIPGAIILVLDLESSHCNSFEGRQSSIEFIYRCPDLQMCCRLGYVTGPVIPTQLVSWLLMSWRLQQPGHQLPQPGIVLGSLEYSAPCTQRVKMILNALPQC